jgi:hypothetical protein
MWRVWRGSWRRMLARIIRLGRRRIRLGEFGGTDWWDGMGC